MDPEYLSSSPTVMAYDYQNADYFAPSAYGQQTPAQAAFAVAKAAEPILASMPSSAPLVGHPVPNYPRQGHVPKFTSPMDAGNWNIRGVDIPTYAPALPPMPGSDWRTFPQPIDGAQLSAARPQFAAFAGYGAATIRNYDKPGIGRFRDVQDNAYRYRQFADGTIQILISPRPDLLAPGAFLKGVAEDPNYKNWVAITSRIGAWGDFAKKRGEDILRATATSAIAAASAVSKGGRRRRKKATAAAMAPASAVVEPEAEEEKSWLSGPLPWVIGGTVLAVTVLFISTRSSRGK